MNAHGARRIVIGGFQELGAPFWSPYATDHGILGSSVGPRSFFTQPTLRLCAGASCHFRRSLKAAGAEWSCRDEASVLIAAQGHNLVAKQ